MKVIVFGGTGLVGNSLINEFLKQGHEVACVSKSRLHPKVFTINIDITDINEFDLITFKPDVVLNCSSLIPQTNKSSIQPDFVSDLFKINVVGGLNIANWAVKNNVKSIINYSTLVTVKKPWPAQLSEGFMSTPDGFHVGYCMSKLSQEQIMSNAVESSLTQIAHLRLSSVYGDDMPKVGLIYNLVDRLSSGTDVNLTNGNKVFLNFIHTSDIARITSEMIKIDLISNGLYNCASLTEISIIELAQLLKDILESSSEIINKDHDILVQNASINCEKLISILPAAFNYEENSLKGHIENLIKNHRQ